MAGSADSRWEDVFGGRTAIVTGGYGFIGSAIVRKLVEAGAEVRVVDALFPEMGGNRFNLASCEGRFAAVESDYALIGDWSPILAGAGFLFHLAGQTGHADSMAEPERDLSCNQTGLLRLLEACRRHAPQIRVVLAGTRQVYGRARTLPVDEDHPLQPPDLNAVHKIAAEHYLRVYGTAYGIAGTSLRLTNTYGPGMRIRDARQMFLGIWLRRLIENQPFEVWGRDVVRDFTHVDDCCEAFLLAAADERAAGRTYNLGAAVSTTLGELAELLVRLAGSGGYVVRDMPGERQRIDIGDFYADWRRIGAELGWRPGVDLEEGLRETLAWYRRHFRHYV